MPDDPKTPPSVNCPNRSSLTPSIQSLAPLHPSTPFFKLSKANKRPLGKSQEFLAVLVPLINQHSSPIKSNKHSKVTDTVGKTVGGVTDTVGKTVGGVGEGVGNTVGGATKGVGETTQGAGNTVKDTTGSVGNSGDKQSAQNPLGLS